MCATKSCNASCTYNIYLFHVQEMRTGTRTRRRRMRMRAPPLKRRTFEGTDPGSRGG